MVGCWFLVKVRYGYVRSLANFSNFCGYLKPSLVVLLVKNLPAKAGDAKRQGSDPWVGKIPWRRKWQPTPAFLPGEFHGQRSLVHYSPWSQTVRHDWAHPHTCDKVKDEMEGLMSPELRAGVSGCRFQSLDYGQTSQLPLWQTARAWLFCSYPFSAYNWENWAKGIQVPFQFQKYHQSLFWLQFQTESSGTICAQRFTLEKKSDPLNLI